jgi:hypothetical protein
MISKRYITGMDEMAFPGTSILEVSSKGIESAFMQKTAAKHCPLYKNIKPEKGYSFLHIITTGGGERYGANSNADYYNEVSRPFTFTSPAPGIQKTAQLAGGLKDYHCTYMQFGGVYRQHRNSKKGFQKEGTVVAEWVNPEMHRGEVIVKLEDEKWGEALQKLAKGEQVAWSQGSGVPYDICSNCGHKAKTRAQYCSCLKYNKLELDKEGRQIFAINDMPHFHDISEVTVPADKLALTLQKVAAQRGTYTSLGQFIQESTEGLYIPLSLMHKLASKRELDRLTLLQKLAKVEKEIKVNPLGSAEDVAEAMQLSEEEEKDVVKNVEGISLDKLLAGLDKKNMLLTPNTFIRIVIGKWPQDVDNVKNFPGALQNVFEDMMEDGNLKDVLEDSSFTPCCNFPDTSVSNKLNGLSDLLSLDAEPVRKRVITITIAPKGKGSMSKEAQSGEPTEEAKVLAREYAKYQLAFLARKGDSVSTHLALLRNR